MLGLGGARAPCAHPMDPPLLRRGYRVDPRCSHQRLLAKLCGSEQICVVLRRLNYIMLWNWKRESVAELWRLRETFNMLRRPCFIGILAQQSIHVCFLPQSFYDMSVSILLFSWKPRSTVDANNDVFAIRGNAGISHSSTAWSLQVSLAGDCLLQCDVLL